MVLTPFLIGVILFIIAYFTYGRYISKKLGVSNKEKTPAHQLRDNIDFMPTRKEILFGHHFASISGAGPIVGPVLGGFYFGWLPAFLWIVLGSIFMGGVHDFSVLVASIRHKARTIAEVAKQQIGKKAYTLMLLFIWLTLVYVLIVFLDLTATTFATNGAVATTSIIYIFLAVLFGISLYKLRTNFSITTIIFVLLVLGGIYIGYKFPITFKPLLFASQPALIALKKNWAVILFIYIFIASVVPVWILLQPRDYLSSFLLYLSVIVGIIGILFGGYRINFPAYKGFVSDQGTLFPILFVTIACGAISGFHSLVSSGTSAKQLDKESDSQFVGYGGMLMEGIVALIALATIMIAGSLQGKTPIQLYAAGIGKFAGILGIPQEIGKVFGLLVLSSFLLTTLDTATRIARYALQEFMGWNIRKTRFVATGITLILPLIFAFIDFKQNGKIVPAWRLIWPVFGATNQLLAALALLTVSVWLINSGKKPYYTIIPMFIMFIITLTAIVQLVIKFKFSIVGIIAGILFILAIYLVVHSYKVLKSRLKTGQ